jgi:hypothetical protein
VLASVGVSVQPAPDGFFTSYKQIVLANAQVAEANFSPQGLPAQSVITAGFMAATPDDMIPC